MTVLEDIELEGDISQLVLMRFLTKHRGLRSIRIQGNILSDRIQPFWSRNQPFLPNIRTLHAPLAVCCEVIGQASDPSSLYDLHVEMSWIHLHDPLFLCFMETLQCFQKLDHLGLRLVPSPLSATPQASPSDHNWVRYPTSELRQVRTLSFFRGQGLLSPGEIVCLHILSCFLYLIDVTGHNACLHRIISNAGNSPCSRGRSIDENGAPRIPTQGKFHTSSRHCLFRFRFFLEVDSR